MLPRADISPHSADSSSPAEGDAASPSVASPEPIQESHAEAGPHLPGDGLDTPLAGAGGDADRHPILETPRGGDATAVAASGAVQRDEPAMELPASRTAGEGQRAAPSPAVTDTRTPIQKIMDDVLSRHGDAA